MAIKRWKVDKIENENRNKMNSNTNDQPRASKYDNDIMKGNRNEE